jgi:hypothetical protein
MPRRALQPSRRATAKLRGNFAERAASRVRTPAALRLRLAALLNRLLPRDRPMTGQ